MDGDDDIDTTVDGLGAGQEREVAFDNVHLKKGQHTLKAVADPSTPSPRARTTTTKLKVSCPLY